MRERTEGSHSGNYTDRSCKRWHFQEAALLQNTSHFHQKSANHPDLLLQSKRKENTPANKPHLSRKKPDESLSPQYFQLSAKSSCMIFLHCLPESAIHNLAQLVEDKGKEFIRLYLPFDQKRRNQHASPKGKAS